MNARVSARLILVAAALLLLAACRRGDDGPPTDSQTPGPSATVPASPGNATPGIAPGPRTEAGSVTVDGRARTWRLYVPGSLRTGEAAPLVIGLHGGIGSGEQFARNTRFDEQAEAGGFFAVYPDGTGIAKTWNAGACCGYAQRNGVDDVAFISALIDEIAAKYPVDAARVYAVGHSNGAMMALRLACEVPDRLAAVGAVAGSLETGCNPGRAVPVLLIHGDADESHPIEGGSGPNSLAGVEFNSVADTMETLRGANGCSAETEIEAEGEVTTTRWACAEGADVILEVIAGGPHAWPGGTGGIALIGEPSKAVDATAELWRFLSTHRR